MQVKQLFYASYMKLQVHDFKMIVELLMIILVLVYVTYSCVQ